MDARIGSALLTQIVVAMTSADGDDGRAEHEHGLGDRQRVDALEAEGDGEDDDRGDDRQPRNDPCGDEDARPRTGRRDDGRRPRMTATAMPTTSPRPVAHGAASVGADDGALVVVAPPDPDDEQADGDQQEAEATATAERSEEERPAPAPPSRPVRLRIGPTSERDPQPASGVGRRRHEPGAGGRVLTGQHEGQHQVGDDADARQAGDDERHRTSVTSTPVATARPVADAGHHVAPRSHEPPLGARRQGRRERGARGGRRRAARRG